MPYKKNNFAYRFWVSNDELDPKVFPELLNHSAAPIWKFISRPNVLVYPELVYVPMSPMNFLHNEQTTREQVMLNMWNQIWEAGPFRYDAVHEELPEKFFFLERCRNQNIYLLPDYDSYNYEIISPLYHLLPACKLKRFGLPTIRLGFWPPQMYNGGIRSFLPQGFHHRFSEAFAQYIWPFLNVGAKLNAFSDNDPVVLLAHNIDFWLPYIYMVAEETIREFRRVPLENKEERDELARLKKQMPPDILIDQPLRGGSIWYGENDARDATKRLITYADEYGNLRSIIDAIRSNRVKDDFSDLWSYAREDFERKLYHKRSKISVSFVQIDDSIPVHGRHSEVHENLLWEDFLALLKPKERKIVICLRNGKTNLGDIANSIGYINHSPISKALSQIRKKAIKYLSE